MKVHIVTGIIETTITTVIGTFLSQQHFNCGVYVNFADAEQQALKIQAKYSHVTIEEHDVHGAKGWV